MKLLIINLKIIINVTLSSFLLLQNLFFYKLKQISPNSSE